MALDIKPVAQAQRTEFIFGEITGQKTADLIPILGDTLVNIGPGLFRSYLYITTIFLI